MQARWLRLTVRDSRTPTTRTQKLSRRLLRNDRCPCRASRRAAVTSLFIRTPIRSQTNRKFYAPVSLLPENVVYRDLNHRFLVNLWQERLFHHSCQGRQAGRNGGKVVWVSGLCFCQAGGNWRKEAVAMVWLGSGLRRSRPLPSFRLFRDRCALERVEHIAAQGVDAGDLEALVVRHRISGPDGVDAPDGLSVPEWGC